MVIAGLRSWIAVSRSFRVMGLLSPCIAAASCSSFVIAMSCWVPSLPIVYALLPGFLKSPKDSIAVAKAETSVLLSSVMPLEARMCTGKPGSGFGVWVGVLVVLAVC